MKDSDIRKMLTEEFKPRYIAAYKRDDDIGDNEMELISEYLMMVDLGNSTYDESDFYAWLDGVE
jgi:hypothetical protein